MASTSSAPTTTLPGFGSYLNSTGAVPQPGSAFPGSSTPSNTSLLLQLFGTGANTQLPTGTSGFSKADQAKQVWVPDTAGTTSGVHLETVGEYLSQMAADPTQMNQWVAPLEKAGYLTPNPGAGGVYDPITIMTALARALVYASAPTGQMTGPGGTANRYGTNITDYLAATALAATSQPGGSQRFFKGTTTEVTLTGPGAVQVDGSQVAEQMVGRKLTGAQVDAITAILNHQEVAEGTIRSLAAQAQQAGLYEAYQPGGSELAPGGPTAGSGATTGGTAPADAGQLAQLAYNAGLRGQALTTAVAVALAESSGNTAALNDNAKTGDYSVGAWQVNYFGNLMASRTATYGSPQTLQNDPQAQAAAMADISNGGKDFSAWTTYTSGAYKQYLGQAASAASAIKSQAPVSIPQPPGSTSTAVSPAGTFTNAAGQPVQQGPPAPGQTTPSGTPSNATAITAAPPPGVTPLPAGSQIPAAPGTYQMGQASAFSVPTGTDYVLPAQAAVVQAPETVAQATGDYLMNQDSGQYQAENLTNVFAAIQQLLSKNTGAAKAAGSPVATT